MSESDSETEQLPKSARRLNAFLSVMLILFVLSFGYLVLTGAIP